MLSDGKQPLDARADIIGGLYGYVKLTLTLRTPNCNSPHRNVPFPTVLCYCDLIVHILPIGVRIFPQYLLQCMG